MSSIADLFDVYHLFQYRASEQFSLFTPLIILFGFLFFAGLVIRFFLLSHTKKVFVKHYYASLVTDLFIFSLLGVMLLFFRKVGVNFLSARIFLEVLLFLIIWKGIYFIAYRIVYFPKFLSIHFREQKRLQYLPKRKKKKNK